MRRGIKVKAAGTGGRLRKAAVTANAAARRPFPAWIDASESAVAFPARGAMPRVRDGLPLRTVERAKPGKSGGSSHGRVSR